MTKWNQKMFSLRATARRLLVALSIIFSITVFGLELQDAKVQGLVGETESGYLEAVKSGGDVSSLVRDINDQRRAEYQRIAAKNNIAIGAVESLAGKKAIEKTPTGQYVKVNGRWIKK